MENTTDLKIKEENEGSLMINLGSPLPILLRQAEMVISSGLAPSNIVEASQVLVIWTTGKEIGIPPMAALNNIYIVDGRPVLNKHIVNTLVQREGWTPVKVEDMVQLPSGDFRTTYRFIHTEKVKKIREEKKKLITEFGDSPHLESLMRDLDFELSAVIRDFSFSWNDAQLQKLTGKSNWQKMPRIMLETRALTLGAREVAPAAMMGMMEVSEMADVKNVEYVLDDDGNAILQQ